MWFSRFVKWIFGKHDLDCEYWVYLKDIKVNPEWEKTRVGEEKLKRKLNYWYKTGEFQSPILLDEDFNLLDGYTSVVIAEMWGIDKVPVYFKES